MLTFGSRLASALGFVLRRHERHPNVSTHIGIAAVLWDQTIKSVCAVMFVLICSMVWSQSNAAIRMSTLPLEFNLGFVLRRHDRDPNVSTHIRIAAVLWKPMFVCVRAYVCFICFMVWSQSKAAIRM